MSPPLRRRFWGSLAALAASVPVFRPGTSVPASAGPYLGAPSDDAPARAPGGRKGALRRSLEASAAEGMAAEVVTACAGGAVLTGWALHVGCGPMLLGIVGALPFFAQAVQLPAAWLTQRFGARRVALVAVTASRQVLLPLVVLPFLDLSQGAQQAAFVAVSALAAALAVVGNNAWVTWMGDLVPRRIRGRYFGRRTALCTAAGASAALTAGAFLDAARLRGWEGAGLAALALVACVSGAIAAVLMRRQMPSAPVVAPPLRPREALAVLRLPSVRPLLAYQVAWNAAVGVAASFFAAHMLQNLRMGFVLMAVHGTAVATVRILAAPVWGRTLDRVGARPVLVACSFGIATIPALWVLPAEHRLWPLALDALLSGVLWGGHGLAAFQLPLAVLPRERRPFLLAIIASAGGLAFAAASALGGVIAASLPGGVTVLGQQLSNLHVLFLLSSAARLGAAVLSVRIVEPGSRNVEALWTLAAARLRPAGRYVPGGSS